MSARPLSEFAAGGGSTAVVSAFLNPVDVIKTRRQLERFKSSTALDVAKGLYEEGGAIALWKPGLTATVAREIVYSGCTKGMYPIVRDFIAGKGNEPTLPQRVASASATGFLGSIGANALDVVKIRQFDQPGRYAGGFLGGGVFSPVTAAIGAGIGKTVSDATQWIVGGGKSEKERAIEQLIATRGGI